MHASAVVPSARDNNNVINNNDNNNGNNGNNGINNDRNRGVGAVRASTPIPRGSGVSSVSAGPPVCARYVGVPGVACQLGLPVVASAATSGRQEGVEELLFRDPRVEFAVKHAGVQQRLFTGSEVRAMRAQLAACRAPAGDSTGVGK